MSRAQPERSGDLSRAEAESLIAYSLSMCRMIMLVGAAAAGMALIDAAYFTAGCVIAMTLLGWSSSIVLEKVRDGISNAAWLKGGDQ